jgi:hypothetical protein
MSTTAIPPQNTGANPPPQPAPTQPAQAAAQQAQGLPPTGLQQQMTSLNNMYENVQNAQSAYGGIGYDVRSQQFQQAQLGQPQLANQQTGGSTNLDQMARNLAQRYGLPIGRGRLVDESGNLMMTPEQLAAASGGSVTLGEAAAKMNYISQAITRQQNEAQQQKGIAALQTGIGQVQSNARGSLASLQQGLYQGLADMYANQEYEAADFSYFIQKEQLDIAQELQRRQERLAKKQARGQFLSGIGIGVAGLATGNVAMAAGGAAQAGGSAASTGWF